MKLTLSRYVQHVGARGLRTLRVSCPCFHDGEREHYVLPHEVGDAAGIFFGRFRAEMKYVYGRNVLFVELLPYLCTIRDFITCGATRIRAEFGNGTYDP